MPAWAITTAIAGVESQSTDGAEDVSAFGVDGDPFAWSWQAVVHEIAAGHGFGEQSGVDEHVGGGAGAIVARGVVDIAPVTAAIDVGFALQAIAGSHGAVDGGWSGLWCDCIFAWQDDGAAVNELVLVRAARGGFGRAGDAGVLGFATAEAQCGKQECE